MSMESSSVARVKNDCLEYQYRVLGIHEYMGSTEVTEICINRPG